MTELDKAKEFNNQTKEAVSVIYNSLNAEQQKSILKNPDVKSVLLRYRIISED